MPANLFLLISTFFSSVHSYRSYTYFGGIFGSTRLQNSSSDKLTLVRQGMEFKAAFLMAINEINNKHDGLYDDILPSTTIYPVVGVSQDDNFFTTIAAEYFTSLTSAAYGFPLDLIIGPNGDNAFGYSADLTASTNVMNLAFASVTSKITDKSQYPQTVRVSHSSIFEGVSLVPLFVHFSWKRVCIFASTDTYGTNNVVAFRTARTQYGVTISVVGSFTFSVIHKTFTTIIQNAKALDCFVFIIFAPSEPTGRLLEQGYDAGLFKQGTIVIGGSNLASLDTMRVIKNKNNIPAIMKGTLSITPAFSYKSSSAAIDFVRRWRAQKPSSYAHNGQPVCSNTTDAFGNLLYAGRHYYNAITYDKDVCDGLDFSTYATDGSDLDMNVGFAYDATVAAAYAVHEMIYVKKKDVFSTTELVNTLLQNVSFAGVTGPVDFSSGVNEDMDGAGERVSGLTYAILNFNSKKFAMNSSAIGFVPALEWAFGGSIVVCSTCSTFEFNTADNSPPSDSATEIVVDMTATTQTALSVCGLLCLAILCRYFVYMLYYQKNRLIRASQPLISYGMLLAGLLGCLKILVNTSDSANDIVCIVELWLPHLSYALALSCIIAKCWVINKIFNTELRKIRIKPVDSVVNIAMVMSVVVFFLMLITFLGHPRRTSEVVRPTLNDQPKRYFYCKNSDDSINSILKVLHILALLLSIRMALSIWNVPNCIHESAAILSVIAIISMAVVVDVIVIYVSGEQQKELSLTSDFIFGAVIFLSAILLFEPKAYIVRNGYMFDMKGHLVRGGTIYDKNSTDRNDSASVLKSIFAVEDVLAALRSNRMDENKILCNAQIELGTKRLEALTQMAGEWNEAFDAVARHDVPTFVRKYGHTSPKSPKIPTSSQKTDPDVLFVKSSPRLQEVTEKNDALAEKGSSSAWRTTSVPEVVGDEKN